MFHVVDLQILVNNKPIPQYFKDSKTYIEARKNSEFSIQLRNLTFNRVLANLTIDGLSVMNGEIGSTKEPKGYVLGPYETVTINGWRLDNNDIAKFRFTEKPGAYAEKIGKGGNVGVIGLAVYREQSIPYYNPYYNPWTPNLLWNPDSVVYGGSTGCNPSFFHTITLSSGTVTNSVTPVENQVFVTMDSNKVAGTEFGPKVHSPVNEINLNLESNDPVEVRSIEYKFRPELEKLGIQLNPPATIYRADAPNPFPADKTGCKPPTDWNG